MARLIADVEHLLGDFCSDGEVILFHKAPDLKAWWVNQIPDNLVIAVLLGVSVLVDTTGACRGPPRRDRPDRRDGGQADHVGLHAVRADQPSHHSAERVPSPGPRLDGLEQGDGRVGQADVLEPLLRHGGRRARDRFRDDLREIWSR